MSKPRVTSAEVARRAGVSRSAVSRVFTPGASASQATAAKVRKAAQELGYRPNVLARAMVSGRTRIIGLVVAYLDNHFYPDALERLSKVLQAEGYHVLVFLASQTMGDVDRIVDEILDYQPDGIIAASVALGSDLMKRCHAADVPVVLFNRSQDDGRLSSVTSDNFTAGRLAVEHLLQLGRERIGYIAGWEGASTQRDRESGVRGGLQAAGCDLYARQLGNFAFRDAEVAARAMFDRKDRPDAVVVCNDHMAFAVLDVLRHELGLDVPSEVAVVGFDDVPMASWRGYDLTTVRQDADAMVARTVDILTRQIETGQELREQFRLPVELIPRGSTASPK